jgi:uncharacterized protein (DUF1800 family)
MLRRTLPVLLLLLGQASAQTPAGPAEPSLGPRERALHVLSRLAFGPRPGDLEAVQALGVEAWIARQLAPGTIADPRSEAALALLPTLGLTPRELRDLAEGRSGRPARDFEDVRQDARRELKRGVALAAIHSERQLLEVMAHFWRNHFNVDVAKESVAYTATHYEHHVLRPHALGRFPDLLAATARHPAMLVYLDNALSRRPPSKSELRQLERRIRKSTGSPEAAREQAEIARQAGLNENYARELLELHTLGVDNGYTQKDVIEVARAFTGWTVDFDHDPVGFRFRSDMHDPGPKTVLGRAVAEGRQDQAIQEGEVILRRLSAHPNTAGFVARKLAVLLVHDDPPTSLVEAAARAFRTSKGDIPDTIRAIVQHPAFFDRRHFRAKFKTPFEFVISALRATGAEVEDAEPVVTAIADLGMPIYGCEDPTGYDDDAESWRDPGVMAQRWRFATRLAMGQMRGVRLPPEWFDALPADPLELVRALERRILPGGVSQATRAVLERVMLEEIQAGSLMEGRGRIKLARRLTAILLGSPEFQQQ